MNQRAVVSSAFASVLALGLVGPSSAAEEKGKERCYGVAKAGQNECASLSGSHDCHAEAKVDNAPEDWKLVAKGTCKAMKGLTEDEARAALKK
jgi:uncharacterized membrane protein